MAKKNKTTHNTQHHDGIFRDIYSDRKFALDIFRLVFGPREFDLFDWRTLKSTLTVYFGRDDGKRQEVDLAFQVRPKGGGDEVGLVFLIEHKSSKKAGLFNQLLRYQAAMYDKESIPILPILAYNGKTRKWNTPLRFQQSLSGMTDTIQKAFGRDILDFGIRLLNIRDMESWQGKKDLTSDPILWLMSNIWEIDEKTLREFIARCKTLDKEAKSFFISKGIDYAHIHNPKVITWALVKKIGGKSMKPGPLSTSLLRERTEGIEDGIEMGIEMGLEEGMEKGMEKGIEKGMEKGMEKGREEGMEKSRQGIALQMLAEGENIPKICKYTGLTQKQVKALESKRAA